METIIARQPIFNHKKRLFAYEPLYRGTKSLSLENIGGERATTSLFTSIFLTEEVKLTLTSQNDPLSAFLTTVISHEKGEHEKYNQSLKHIKVDKQDLHVIYLDAVAYAENLVSL